MNKQRSYQTKFGGFCALLELAVIIAFAQSLIMNLVSKKVTYSELKVPNLARNDGVGYSDIKTSILDYSI